MVSLQVQSTALGARHADDSQMINITDISL